MGISPSSTANALGITQRLTVSLWWRHHAIRIRREGGPKHLDIGDNELSVSIEPIYGTVQTERLGLRFVRPRGLGRYEDIPKTVVEIVGLEIQPRPGEEIRHHRAEGERDPGYTCCFDDALILGPKRKLQLRCLTVVVHERFKGLLSADLFFPEIGTAYGRKTYLAGYDLPLGRFIRKCFPIWGGG